MLPKISLQTQGKASSSKAKEAEPTPPPPPDQDVCFGVKMSLEASCNQDGLLYDTLKGVILGILIHMTEKKLQSHQCHQEIQSFFSNSKLDGGF